jgi:putative nucleotidyltransferase with HDIG domain
MAANDNRTVVPAVRDLAARLMQLVSRRHDVAPRSELGPEVRSERELLAEQLDLELERAKRGARYLSLVIGEVLPPDVGSRDGSSQAPPSPSVSEVIDLVVASEKRRIDTATAIGHDRFALILPETDSRGALTLSDRLRDAIARAFEKQGAHPSASFGIATFPRHGRSSAALVKAAERALEAVRSLGGDRSLLESAAAPATMVSVSKGAVDSDLRLETMLALAETVDIRDQGSAVHSHAVGRYAEQIARELGLPVTASDRVRLAGILHDVGKVGVPASVLQKPGPLDEGEWELVRSHPELGARLIDDPGLEDVREWVLAHQERPDGKGYPRGLRGDTIPLEARIIGVADAYESMTSERPYRSALSHAAAQTELAECSGTQFDQRIVQAFTRVLEREGLRASLPPIVRR